MNLKRLEAWSVKLVVPVLAALFCCGSLHAASFRASRVPAGSLHLQLNANAAVHGPALQGGFALSRLPATSFVPSLLPVAPGLVEAPALGRSLAASGGGTSAPYGAVVGGAASLSAGQPMKAGAFASATDLSMRLADDGVDKSKVSNGVFDGSNNGNGGSGVNGGEVASGELGKLYPRVVVILDTFVGPASDKLVRYVETLADKGVRVIFATPRPDKGPDSADSVLVSKLKVRVQKYPVIVASYNGSRIMVHSSRAENPKPIVADQPGFAAATIETFRAINEQVRKELKLRGALAETAVPSIENPYIYGAALPKKADGAAFVKAYNKALKAAGLLYKVEVARNADGTQSFFTQSTALRLNTGRLFNALYAQYPELKDSLKPEEVLVLADSRKASGFLKTLENGTFVQGVTDDASAASALGAVLGQESLEKVGVTRSQLNDYNFWLETRRKFSGEKGGGFGGGSPRSGKVLERRAFRELGGYRGKMVNQLMNELYKRMRKGQYAIASPEAARELLRAMWFTPRAYGMFITPELDKLRHSRVWKKLEAGYLEIAQTWVANYYKRNFKDWPNGVSQNAVAGLMNLKDDSKNSVTLEFASPYTGRRYTVGVKPSRASNEYDDKGWVLLAHVYRSGVEPYQSEFEDSLETNLVAYAMLKGYAQKRADGLWYHNDAPNPRVRVVFHYMTRELSRIMTPQEIEARSADVTALIERMRSDKEFLEYWEQKQLRENPAKAAKAAKKAAEAAKKAAESEKKSKKK